MSLLCVIENSLVIYFENLHQKEDVQIKIY